jgi:uncharacterized protein YraI
MVPRLIAAAVLVAAVLPIWSTAATAKPVTLAGETNLRKAPGTKSEVVTLMPMGATVVVGDCVAGWCLVTWNGKNGYAIARNLGLAPRRTAAVRPPPPRDPVYEDDGDDDGPPVVYEYGSPPPYVMGPPVYYGYYGYPRPWRWGGYRHHHWRHW